MISDKQFEIIIRSVRIVILYFAFETGNNTCYGLGSVDIRLTQFHSSIFLPLILPV